ICSVQGAKLPNQIVIANVQVRLFTLELHVLRFTAEHGVFKDAIPGTKTSETFDHGMGTYFALRSNLNIVLDNGIGPYSDVLANRCLDSDQRGGMDRHRLFRSSVVCGG